MPLRYCAIPFETLRDPLGQLRPHVQDALAALRDMKAGRHRLSLIAVVRKADEQVVNDAGLAEYFPRRGGLVEPGHGAFGWVDHLTAAPRKAAAEEIIVIVERPAAVRQAKELGLSPLRLADHPEADARSWAAVPLTVAMRLDPMTDENLAAALRVYVPAHTGGPVLAFAGRTDPNTVRLTVADWCPIRGAQLGPLNGIYVQMPVSATVHIGRRGSPGVVAVEKSSGPGPETVRRSVEAVRMLMRDGLISPTAELRPGTTHVVEQVQGQRRLHRRLFD